MQRVLNSQRGWRAAIAMLATVAAAMATVMFVPPAQAQPPGQSACLAAEYSATSWNNGPDNGGFIATVTITNTCEETAQGWTVQFTLPPQHEFVNGWSADWTTSGNVLTGTDTGWNGEVPAGGSVHAGFIGAFSGGYKDPISCTVNGAECEGYGSGPGENQPPEVALTGNLALTYRCPMTLSAEASDPDGEIERVEFYVNGELVGTAQSAPYQVHVFPDSPTWNWDGEDQVWARAYDDGDPQLSTDSDPVAVPVLPPPPVAEIRPCRESVELEPGASETVRVTSQGCGSIEELEVVGDPGISATLEWFEVNPRYEVTITAASDAGASAQVRMYADWCVGIINVQVTGEPGSNQPPEVALTRPADGSNLTVPCAMRLRATAHDPDGAIDRVEFYLNDELVGTVDSTPYHLEVPYSHPAVVGGTNVAYARAYDDGDPQLSTDSDPASFGILVPPPGPFVIACGSGFEVPEGGSEVLSYHNLCYAGPLSMTAEVVGDPGITVEPAEFVLDDQADLTVTAAPGTAGATATVTVSGGCTSPSVQVTVVPGNE